MEKTKITNHQLFTLTASFTCGSSIIAFSSLITTIAKQDAWISAIVTNLFALLELWIVFFLWNRFSGFTYIQIMQKVFGKWIGWIAGAVFVFFCLLSTMQDTWYMSNFMTLEALNGTPPYAISMVYMIVIVIALIYGLEVIARSYEILLYVASGLFIIAMVFNLQNFKIENFQPVFEKGIAPILTGSLYLSFVLTVPIFILLMVYPNNADNTKEARGSVVKGYIWGWFLVFTSIVMSISILGPSIAADYKYPIYTLSKEINVGIVFSRLEFIISGVWIITLLIRGIMYLYAGVIGLSQLLGLKDYKKIILPLGIIVLIMSQISFKNVAYQENWDAIIWPPYILTLGVFIPAILIITYLFKKWVFKNICI